MTAGNLPFGRTKTPLSAPVWMALLSWVICALPMSSLYLSSTYLSGRKSQGGTGRTQPRDILLDLGA